MARRPTLWPPVWHPDAARDARGSGARRNPWETEEEQLDWLDDPAAQTEGLLSGIPIVGGLLDGILGGGGGGSASPAPGGGLGGLLGGGGGGGGLLGNLLGPISGILGGLGGGLNGALGQGLGLGPAGTPGAGLLGTGLSGGFGAGGTGPLPGQLGDILHGILGATVAPALQQANQLAADRGMANEFERLKRATVDTGRGVAQRVLGVSKGDLDNITAMLDRGQTQIAATAEHRNINNDGEFKNQVKSQLDSINHRLGLLQRGQAQLAAPTGRRY